MKSSDEMIADLKIRRDNYLADRQRKRRMFLKALLPALLLSIVLTCLIVISSFADRKNRTERGEISSYRTSSLVKEITVPCPPDYSNIVRIGETDYSATYGSDRLPDGYVFLREISDKESAGTGLGGCKIYVLPQSSSDMILSDFWLYQPIEKLTTLPYSGEKFPITFGSENCPEWIYTHWEIAPPPPERYGLED